MAVSFFCWVLCIKSFRQNYQELRNTPHRALQDAWYGVFVHFQVDGYKLEFVYFSITKFVKATPCRMTSCSFTTRYPRC